MGSFYKKDEKSAFSKWEHIEQETILFEAVMAHSGLRKCLRSFLLANFLEKREHRAVDFYKAYLEWLVLGNGLEKDRKACEIHEQFLLDDKVFGCPADLPNVCADPEAASNGLPKAAKAITSALKAAHFSADGVSFRASAEYTQCKGKSFVESDIHNYKLIEAQFCAGEGEAYKNGGPERQAETEAILCAHDKAIFNTF